MEQTKNLNLNRWAPEDFVRLTQINQNFDKIDAEVGALRTATQTAGNCRIVTGSYVGTGSYGSATPNTLTFPGKPLMVFVNGGFTFTAVSPANTTAVFQEGGNMYYSIQLTWQDNSVSWYHENSVGSHMNVLGRTYYYMALLTA